jgi:integration host factor subunit beta
LRIFNYIKQLDNKGGGAVSSVTKKDIVIKVSNETNLTQIDVKKIVQRTLDVIVESLERGETVELRNFGVFKVKHRRGRLGRNPRTGEEVSVPEKKVVVFKPGLILKGKVK